jgi:hypothetical protein
MWEILLGSFQNLREKNVKIKNNAIFISKNKIISDKVKMAIKSESLQIVTPNNKAQIIKPK